MEVGIAENADSLLARFRARASALVRTVELVEDIHPGHDSSDRNEFLRIYDGVVLEVYEELRGAGVGFGSLSEDEGASDVGFDPWLVSNPCFMPLSLHWRFTVNTELSHEVFEDTMETNVFEETNSDKVIKPVGAVWCPSTSDFDDRVALRRL